MSSFQRAAGIQLRVIGALMLRHLVILSESSAFGAYNVAVRPIVIIAGMYITGRVASGLAPKGFPLLIFSGSGFLTWLAFVQYVQPVPVGKSIRLLMFPHVTPLDLILAVLAVNFVVYTIILFGFGFVGTLFEQVPPPADPLGVVFGFWSALLLGLSVGLILTCIGRFTHAVKDLSRIVHYIGHFVSGVFLLATDTPEFLLRYLRWNPIFHCIELVRQSWWAPYRSPIADPRYIASCLFFLIAIALAFERGTRRWETE